MVEWRPLGAGATRTERGLSICVTKPSTLAPGMLVDDEFNLCFGERTMMRHANVTRVMAGLFLLAAMASTALAADPNGTWKWKRAAQNDQEVTLVLKAEGEKLTGTITPLAMGEGELKPVEIKNGSFKNDEVAFDLVMDLGEAGGGQSLTIKYKGKLEGDTIKGKYELVGLGDAGGAAAADQTWEAKREKK